MTTCSLISLENTRNNFTSFWINKCYLKKYFRIDSHFTKKNYNKESKLHLSLKYLEFHDVVVFIQSNIAISKFSRDNSSLKVKAI